VLVLSNGTHGYYLWFLHRQIPPIKQQQIPASFRIVLSLNLNIFNDINTTAAIRANNPSISKACAAFQALVHHGLSIPSSVNEKRGMHQGYIKVVTNIVQSNQSRSLILLIWSWWLIIQLHRGLSTSLVLSVWGLKTGITDMFIEPFPSFVPNTHKMYMLGHCIDIVFISQSSVTIIVRNLAQKSN